MSTEYRTHPKLLELREKQGKELKELLATEHKMKDVHRLARLHSTERKRLIIALSKKQAD